MLNRTNLTTTATTNGLNLGTRSLATVAGVFNVAKIQRTLLVPARKFPAPIGIMDPSDPSIMGSRWYVRVPSSPCHPGHWSGGRRAEVVAELPPDGREVVVSDDPAVVSVGRPGGPVKPRRQHAAKPRAAQAAAAARAIAAAKASARPAACFAVGG
jgi:hypothetical protein